MNQNFLLNILGNIGNQNSSSNERSRSRGSHRVLVPSNTKEENNLVNTNNTPNDNRNSYNKMVHHLYKQTLILDQTIINQEEHNDLIETYNELIASKTRSRSHPNHRSSSHTNHRGSSHTSPVSVFYEYTNNDGSRSSVSFSSNSHPFINGMMPFMMQGATAAPQIQTRMWHGMPNAPIISNISYNTQNRSNQFEFDLMDPFDILPGIDNILQSFLRAFTDTGERPDPLSTDVFNTFKEVPFNELGNHTKIDISDNCSICLSGFTENEKEENRKALVVPCGHYFHKSCIKEWLTKCHYKCPICKRSCDPSREENNKKTDGKSNDKLNDNPNDDVNSDDELYEEVN